jgi:hypothetical protein
MEPGQCATLAAAAWVCSAKGRHIHGTAIAIDGGGTPGYY